LWTTVSGEAVADVSIVVLDEDGAVVAERPIQVDEYGAVNSCKFELEPGEHYSAGILVRSSPESVTLTLDMARLFDEEVPFQVANPLGTDEVVDAEPWRAVVNGIDLDGFLRVRADFPGGVSCDNPEDRIHMEGWGMRVFGYDWGDSLDGYLDQSIKCGVSLSDLALTNARYDIQFTYYDFTINQ